MTSTTHLFGFHPVTARLRQRPASVHAIYVARDRRDERSRELLALAAETQRPIHTVDEQHLHDRVGHRRHQGVVAVVDAALPYVTVDDVLEGLSQPALLLVLDGVTDPHNLGACLRSADAFGAQAVIVPKDRAVGVNATVAKAASGAADTVPVIAVTNLVRTLAKLKENGIWVLGADEGGSENLFEADLSGPLAWVLGSEGAGLRRLTPGTMRSNDQHSIDRIGGESECFSSRKYLLVRDASTAFQQSSLVCC